MKSPKISGVISALSNVLEKDPKLSVARLRLLVLIRKYNDKGTTTDLAKELNMDNKYFRKFVAEAEKSGYIAKERFSDDPSQGDCIRYHLTNDSRKLLEAMFGV